MRACPKCAAEPYITPSKYARADWSCLSCYRERGRTFREKNREALAVKQAEWRKNNTDHCSQYKKLFRLGIRSAPNPSEDQFVKRLRYNRNYRSRNRLNYAVSMGKIIKSLQCEGCSKKRKLNGHHHNGYHRPLEITWLCNPCHGSEHRK